MKGSASANHRKYIGIEITIARKSASHDLNFAHVVSGEKRSDGPVDQAGSKDFLGSWSAFTLHEPAREFASGIGFFAIVNNEGEIIFG